MEQKPLKNKEPLRGFEKFQEIYGDIAKIKIDLPCVLCGREYERIIGEICDNWCMQPIFDLVEMNGRFYG